MGTNGAIPPGGTASVEAATPPLAMGRNVECDANDLSSRNGPAIDCDNNRDKDELG
jgi:hypothetical protein